MGNIKQTEFNKETNNRMAAGFTFTSTTIKPSMVLAGFLTVGEAAAELRIPFHYYMVALPGAGLLQHLWVQVRSDSVAHVPASCCPLPH